MIKDSKIYDNVNNKIYYVKLKYNNKNKDRVVSVDIEIENWKTKDKVYDSHNHQMREYMRKRCEDPEFVRKKNEKYNLSPSYKCKICRKEIKKYNKNTHELTKKHTERYEMLKITEDLLLYSK